MSDDSRHRQTLAHELGHAFELCHARSGDIANLMTPSRRETRMRIGQAFWGSFSVNSLLRNFGHGHGSICCQDLSAGVRECPPLCIDPASACRKKMQAWRDCPSQYIGRGTPLEIEAAKDLRETLQDVFLDWIACYDCEPLQLANHRLFRLEFLPESSRRAYGRFLVENLSRLSATHRESLETYLVNLYAQIEGCDLSLSDFLALYRENEIGARVVQVAAALAQIEARDQLRSLLEGDDITTELKRLIRQVVESYGLML